MEKPWQFYAVCEGLTRTVSNLFQKVVGLMAGTPVMGSLSSIIIGAVQLVLGLVLGIRNIRTTHSNRGPILWSLLFGVFATYGTVMSLYTYSIGADLGLRTILVNASVIPGALLGRLLWRDELGLRQWCGIGLYLCAGWAMLGFPVTLVLASWVWWSLTLAFSNTLTEICSRYVGEMNVWVHNFWVGLSTTLCSAIMFGILGARLSADLSRVFVLGTVILGIIAVVMISFKLKAFQGGGTIAVKKVIMPGTFMISALLAGALMYGEPLGVPQFIGMTLWVGAIILIDASVWKWLANYFHTHIHMCSRPD